jgi:hypothetical protein
MLFLDFNKIINLIVIVFIYFYQKEYFLEGNIQKEKLKQLKNIFFVQIIALIQQNIPDAFIILMIYYIIIFLEKYKKY